MNKIVLIIFLLILGCNSAKVSTDKVRKEKKKGNKVKAPGVVWLKDSLLLDETEITNMQYLEYVYWVRRVEGERDYRKLLPDSTCWIKDGVLDNFFSQIYLTYPPHRDFPVTGVSYEQAVKFCEWRTDRVNFNFFIKDHINFKWDVDSLYNIPIYVEYRLPTKEEWEYAARAGLEEKEYPFGYVNLFSKKGNLATNTREYFNLTKLHKKPKESYYYSILAPTENVVLGKRNRFGYYHLLGNVSEMVGDSLIMGLNYQTYLTGLPLYENGYSLSKTIKYTRPKSWLGFRCACVILPEIKYKKVKP